MSILKIDKLTQHTTSPRRSFSVLFTKYKCQLAKKNITSWLNFWEILVWCFKCKQIISYTNTFPKKTSPLKWCFYPVLFQFCLLYRLKILAEVNTIMKDLIKIYKYINIEPKRQVCVPIQHAHIHTGNVS